MPYLIRRDDEPDSDALSEYILESVEEVASLPTDIAEGANGLVTLSKCYPGSVAYTMDGEHIYMLGPDHIWHPW